VHALAEVCHLSKSSKSLLTGLFSRCMQCWPRNHWPGSVRTLSQQWMTKTLPVSMHTNYISNSINSYVFLLSDLCACVQVKIIVSQKKAIIIILHQFEAPCEISKL